MALKKILIYLVFIAAWLPVSCTSKADDDVNPGNGTEMVFDATCGTRSSITTDIDKFAVYGDMIPLNENIVSYSIIFNKTLVSYISGSWRYEGIQYWYPGHEYSFVALNPVHALDLDENRAYTGSGLSFSYRIPTSVSNKSLANNNGADILVATHRRSYGLNDTPTAVSLKFKHVMSLINLAPAYYDNTKEDDDYIKIHKVELSGIKGKSLFEIMPAARGSNRQTDEMIISVTGQEDANISIELDIPLMLKNKSENISLFGNNDALIMLPQVFSANSEAQITLTYTINDDTSEKQVNIALNDLKWESGKSYFYKFTIERTGVELNTCEIKPWNDIEDNITVD